MPARDVILWALDEIMTDEDQRRPSTQLTDVFYRRNRPRPGALMLGIGVARRSQQVATGKDRTSVTPLPAGSRHRARKSAH